jgi:hypothetical protein
LDSMSLSPLSGSEPESPSSTSITSCWDAKFSRVPNNLS